MTNFEYYKKKIKALKYKFAVTRDGDICDCNITNCDDCIFSKISNRYKYIYNCLPGNCNKRAIEWLYQEHIEKPKLSANAHEVLKRLNIKYVVRDENGDVYGCYAKPVKVEDKGFWGNALIHIALCLNVSSYCAIIDETFDFIKWSDPEPWSVEELLKLEVR